MPWILLNVGSFVDVEFSTRPYIICRRPPWASCVSIAKGEEEGPVWWSAAQRVGGEVNYGEQVGHIQGSLCDG